MRDAGDRSPTLPNRWVLCALCIPDREGRSYVSTAGRAFVSGPIFKRSPRIRDPKLLSELHNEWRECAICGATDRLSLHHILKHPRDDVRQNLVMLCGDGVRGCHGMIEAHHGSTERKLGGYLLTVRPDVIWYLRETLGLEAAADWIRNLMSETS